MTLPTHDPLIHAYLELPGEHTLIGFARFMREQLADEVLALKQRAAEMPAFSAMGYESGTEDAARLIRAVD